MKPGWPKYVLLGALVFALGLLIGWWWRGEVAFHVCIEMGGDWLRPGYCGGATKYQLN